MKNNIPSSKRTSVFERLRTAATSCKQQAGDLVPNVRIPNLRQNKERTGMPQNKIRRFLRKGFEFGVRFVELGSMTSPGFGFQIGSPVRPSGNRAALLFFDRGPTVQAERRGTVQFTLSSQKRSRQCDSSPTAGNAYSHSIRKRFLSSIQHSYRIRSNLQEILANYCE